MAKVTGEVHFDEALCRCLLDSIQTQTTNQATLASVPALDQTKESPTLKNIYRSLAGQGVGSVIRIFSNAALEGNSRFVLRADVWISVVDVAEGRELYPDHLQYRSKRQKFSDWAKHDAQPFREAMEQCHQHLTLAIMRGLFFEP